MTFEYQARSAKLIDLLLFDLYVTKMAVMTSNVLNEDVEKQDMACNLLTPKSAKNQISRKNSNFIS